MESDSSSEASTRHEEEEEEEEKSMFEVIEWEDDEYLYGEAALKVGLCKLTWLGSHLAVLVVVSWAIFLIIRFTFRWRVKVYSQVAKERSAVEFSILMGTEVGLLAMAVLLAFLIPRMIMTWTTALVFQYMFLGAQGRHREDIVEDGSIMAVELSISTLNRVLREGNRVAFMVALLCLLSALMWKQNFYIETQVLGMS